MLKGVSMQVPAGGITALLGANGERGIRAAIISAAGFRETGPQGAALERE